MKNKIAMLLLAVVAGVLLSGCTTVGNTKLDNVDNYMKLTPHQSTKQGVYGVFGQPNDVRSGDNGNEVWVYYKVHTRISALDFIPFVGVVAGGTRNKTTFSYFVFDHNGVLQKVSTKSDSHYSNNIAGIARAVSRTSDKTQAERVQEEMMAIGKPFDAKIAKSVAAIRDK